MLSSEKKFLTEIYRQVLRSIHPENLFAKYLQLFEEQLYYKNTLIEYPRNGRMILAGSGKASFSMAEALLPYLPQKPDESLLITLSQRHSALFRTLRGDHPLPGPDSMQAGREMLDLIDSLTEDDVLFYCLSGGSSSLLESAAPGISPEDIREANRVFLARGLNISEINFLRARLSEIKSGRMAERCAADTHVFVLSDVMGNDLSVIGSAPFMPQDKTHLTTEKLMRKYGLDTCLPSHICDLLRHNAPPRHDLRIPHYLIGSNMDMLEGAAKLLERNRIKTLVFPENLSGEASEAGAMIADMVMKYDGPRPACLIFGGETTVTLSDDAGKGGRSQEAALAALQITGNMSSCMILCAGSDGIDGPTDATGAVIDADTFLRAQNAGIRIEEYLSRHDSYHFHEKCDSLIKTGPTGTNVGDIVLALIT